MIEAAVYEQVHSRIRRNEATNPVAMIEMTEKHGVQVRRWDDGNPG